MRKAAEAAFLKSLPQPELLYWLSPSICAPMMAIACW
jgi:hypothetical protein